MLPYIITKQVNDNKMASPKEVLAIEYKKTSEVQEARPPSPTPPPPPEPVKVEAPAAQPPPDLLVIIGIYFGFLLLSYPDCNLAHRVMFTKIFNCCFSCTHELLSFWFAI